LTVLGDACGLPFSPSSVAYAWLGRGLGESLQAVCNSWRRTHLGFTWVCFNLHVHITVCLGGVGCMLLLVLWWSRHLGAIVPDGAAAESLAGCWKAAPSRSPSSSAKAPNCLRSFLLPDLVRPFREGDRARPLASDWSLSLASELCSSPRRNWVMADSSGASGCSAAEVRGGAMCAAS
jgi:hypothetical protein